jgi:hypothetical protein
MGSIICAAALSCYTNRIMTVFYAALLAHQRDASVTYQVEQLRQCISVLFLFQRKPVRDSVFVSDTRQWLSKMVTNLFSFLFQSC